MAINNINNSIQIYDSFLEQSTDNRNEIFTANIESIKKDYNYYHYFCTKCHKFPFINFCKDRKNIKWTCSCFNNKKMLIEELFKINSIEDSISLPLSKTNLNINNESMLISKNIIKNLKVFQNFF